MMKLSDRYVNSSGAFGYFDRYFEVWPTGEIKIPGFGKATIHPTSGLHNTLTVKKTILGLGVDMLFARHLVTDPPGNEKSTLFSVDLSLNGAVRLEFEEAKISVVDLKFSGSKLEISYPFGKVTYDSQNLDELRGDLEDLGISNPVASDFAKAVGHTFTLVKVVEDWVNGVSFDELDGSQRTSALDVDLVSNVATDTDDNSEFGIGDIQHVIGSSHDDSITGDSANNILTGGDGADKLKGGAGNDTLIFDSDDTLVDGGSGRDVAIVDDSGPVGINMDDMDVEVVIGGDGVDTIDAKDTGVSYIASGAGDDIINISRSQGSTAVVWGGEGADSIRANDGSGPLGIMVVNSSEITEENFQNLSLDNFGLGASFNWDEIDVVLINPDSSDKISVNGTALNVSPFVHTIEYGSDEEYAFLVSSGFLGSSIVTNVDVNFLGSGVESVQAPAFDHSFLNLEIYRQGPNGPIWYGVEGPDGQEFYEERIKPHVATADFETEWSSSTGFASRTLGWDVFGSYLPGFSNSTNIWDEDVSGGTYILDFSTLRSLAQPAEHAYQTGGWFVYGGKLTGSSFSSNGSVTLTLPDDPTDSTGVDHPVGGGESQYQGFDVANMTLNWSGNLINPNSPPAGTTFTQRDNAVRVDFGNGDAVTLVGISLDEWQTAAADQLLGTSADEVLVGSEEDNLVVSAGGADVVTGGTGEDNFMFRTGDGSDVITDFTPSEDTLVIDSVGITDLENLPEGVTGLSSEGNYILQYGNGDQIILEATPELYERYPAFFEDPRIHTGTPDQDTLNGSVWDDTIDGLDGNDVIDAGLGDDIMSGGLGADAFQFSTGDGQDRITDYTAEDTIFINGIEITDLGALPDGVTSVAGTDGLELHYGNGDVVVLEDIDLLTPNGKVDGTAGNDVMEVGFTDTQGEAVSDEADTIQAHGGNDTVKAGNGDDVIRGGTGDDILYGQHGNDTFVFAVGDGNDTVYDGGNWQNQETVIFEGRNFDLSQISRSGTALIFDFGDGDSVNIARQTSHTKNDRVDSFVFEDRTLTAVELETLLMEAEITNGDDTVTGTGGNDVIRGGTGDDILYGKEGHDTFVFAVGDGNDTVYDGGNWQNQETVIFEGRNFDLSQISRSGTALIFDFGDGDSVNIARQTSHTKNDRVDSFVFEDRTLTAVELETLLMEAEITDGDDTVTGTGGNDVIRGGTGDDILYGKEGNDTFVFAVGDGNDTVYDGGGWQNNETAIFEGRNFDATQFSQSGNSLLVDFGSGDSVNFAQQSSHTKVDRIETFVFEDRTLTWEELQSELVA